MKFSNKKERARIKYIRQEQRRTMIALKSMKKMDKEYSAIVGPRMNLTDPQGNRIGLQMNAQCWQATWDEGAVRLATVNGNTALKSDDKSQRYADGMSDEQPLTGLVHFKDSASSFDA